MRGVYKTFLAGFSLASQIFVSDAGAIDLPSCSLTYQTTQERREIKEDFKADQEDFVIMSNSRLKCKRFDFSTNTRYSLQDFDEIDLQASLGYLAFKKGPLNLRFTAESKPFGSDPSPSLGARLSYKGPLDVLIESSKKQENLPKTKVRISKKFDLGDLTIDPSFTSACNRYPDEIFECGSRQTYGLNLDWNFGLFDFGLSGKFTKDKKRKDTYSASIDLKGEF